MSDLVHLNLSDLPKATQLVNKKTWIESSLLGYVRVPPKKPISTQVEGLTSSRAHRTSSKGKKRRERKGRLS